uniref:Uncharacterized protein n=1 Tax=Chlorobium chlorochromatii (strain CaD3) TaxID=340177 RepID=Q3AQX3_CHLCH
MNTIDPIVDEIRMYRKEHAALYGYNLHTIVEVLRKKEQESKRIFLNPGPKPLGIETSSTSVATMPHV